MRTSFFVIIMAWLLSACQKESNTNSAADYQCNFSFADSSGQHPFHTQYQTLLSTITGNGAVGISMSVYHSQNGLWLGASGKADLRNNVDMQPCHITRVGSTVKMFTATLILQLQEAGKLQLDDKLAQYLQGDFMDKIENANSATIRQLLQHTSGIYNYIQNLQFQTASLNDWVREWRAEDLLRYAYHKNAYFKPGEGVKYSNTGYILLGLLIEKLEGKPYAQVLQERIADPLGLRFTRFAATDPVPRAVVRGYVDMYSKLEVVESTYFSGWDYYTADGGLISNVYDMNLFFRALMSGQIINAASLSEMLTWRQPQTMPSDFFPIAYGLGIFKIETPQGIAYMHSGDAVGYFANMLYFPSDGTTLVYTVNSNYGKIDQFISARDALQNIIQVTR